MVWTLNRGNRVVLQNFVYSHSDCTKEKLDYWKEYIYKVWKEEGSATCCYEVHILFVVQYINKGGLNWSK